MKDAGLDQLIEMDHQATAAIIKGDPEPKKQLYSRGDYATLANPLGPPARGWQQVEAAASQLRDGETASRRGSSAFPSARRRTWRTSSRSNGPL